MPNSHSRRNRSNNSTFALLSKPPLAPAPQVEGRLVTPGGVGQLSPAQGGHHSIAKPGSLLWQEISPHSSPSWSSETDMEAAVPMLRMYSRWTGETLRRTAKPRSGRRPVSGLRGRHERHGLVAGVRDQPQPVEPVELA